MRTFNNQAAQGDLLIRRIEEIPSGFEVAASDVEGGVVVAHSETGHHHVMLAEPGVEVLRNLTEPGRAVVQVREVAHLEHRRTTHRHETIEFTPGVYELRRQREETPQGWRRVVD